MEKEETLLPNVIGHDEQKKEILTVIDWFKRSEELHAKGASIPKGVILFGAPGNGKSLLIREIIRYVDVPVFVLHGDDENVTSAINNMFGDAKKEKKAIVVIDELDLLINRERRVVRALQENLDGVESSSNVFVLAAANDIEEIPDALVRNGRLEKLIKIPYPSREESVDILKKNLTKFDLSLPNDIDEEELQGQLRHVSCAGLVSIANDIALRNDFGPFTVEDLDRSIYNITDRVKDGYAKSSIVTAYHEAGHAVMASAFPQYFSLKKLYLKGNGGYFSPDEVEEGYWPYDKVLASIQVGLAGLIAEKIIVGYGSRGCERDLEQSRSSIYNLVNRIGYKTAADTLPMLGEGRRTDTWVWRHKNEKKCIKIMKQCERKTTRYIKKNKDKVIALANKLMEKNKLKNSEIIAVIGG